MGGESAPARLEVFGHEPTEATVEVEARSRKWRLGRALRTFSVALVVAPLVGLVPPHAPWALGALGLGVILSRRRFNERHTLLSAEGSCPRCGEPVSVEGPTRLERPHPVPCEACRHESALHVDGRALRPADGGEAPEA